MTNPNPRSHMHACRQNKASVPLHPLPFPFSLNPPSAALSIRHKMRPRRSKPSVYPRHLRPDICSLLKCFLQYLQDLPPDFRPNSPAGRTHTLLPHWQCHIHHFQNTIRSTAFHKAAAHCNFLQAVLPDGFVPAVPRAYFQFHFLRLPMPACLPQSFLSFP